MRKTYNHIIEQVPPDYYQKGIRENFLQRLWHTNKLKEVLKATERSKSIEKILDIGCASGWFLSEVSKKYPKTSCFGIDIYDLAINYAKKRYPKINFKIADAHKIPYKSETFDLVICTEVLEHVDDPQKVLMEIKRILKINCIAIIELDSGSWLFSIAWFIWRKFKGRVWNQAHSHSFNMKKLERMINACDFKILKKKRINLGMAMVFTVKK